MASLPCGIKESAAQPFGVTSLAKLRKTVTQAELDAAMKAAFGEVFGG
jgi:hypothetical protein